MKEVLEQKLKETRDLLNHYEELRDKTPRGSASWRCVNEDVQFYKGEVAALKFAIETIERAQVTK